MRTFSRPQRHALYLLAGGRCGICGVELDDGWHGDHVVPHVRGGPTDVLNGQALCAACNARKGAKVAIALGPWPGNDRGWQDEGYHEWLAAKQRNFLAVATPGSGKTRFGLRVMHSELSSGRAARVVVVVPTEPLKYQWKDKAAEVGIQLNPLFLNNAGGRAEARDYHGVVVTYQQVASNPHFHRGLCNVPTFVAFDEPHHMGDAETLRWGPECTTAFEHATGRLLLTGTAWRTGNDRIPFVNYEHDPGLGQYRSRPDYSYSYERALADGVCRPIYFPSFEGQARWISWSGEERYAQLGDELRDDLASERLRTILSPQGDWLPSVIEQAHARLEELRAEGHVDAAGLILARDQFAAQQIAPVLRKISGEAPFVAISALATDYDAIQNWAKGNGRWIIAVRMVSEGVDIPRLRVGVFATTTLTELFFRQFIGRLVRMIDGLAAQSAFMYIPRVAPLVDYAEQVKRERDHALLAEDDAETPASDARDAQGTAGRERSGYRPLEASAATPHDVIQDERHYSQVELEIARRLRGEVAGASGLSEFLVADLLRAAGAASAGTTSQTGTSAPEAPFVLYDEKKRLRDRCVTLAKQLYEVLDRSIDIKAINRYVSHETGNYIPDASLDQLEARKALLLKFLADLDYARRCLANE